VLAAFLVNAATHGQGTILFNTRVTGQVDAPWSLGDGKGWGQLGAATTAQLFLVTGAGASSTYTPLFPKTTFRTTSPAAEYYVVQPNGSVVVPGVPAGSQATIVMRGWAHTAEYDNAVFKGQSNPITITLGGVPTGGGAPIPDAVLVGMLGVRCIPEPSTMGLALVGGAILLCRRRGK